MPTVPSITEAIDDCLAMIEVLQNASDACKRTLDLIQQIEDYMTTKYGLEPIYDPVSDEDLIALMDELYDLKLELQSDLQAMADAIGPTSTDILSGLCAFSAENPELLYMAPGICGYIQQMADLIDDINIWGAALFDGVFPPGSSPPHEHWGMLDPKLSGGRLQMPTGTMAEDITVAVMYNVDVPGEPMFRNVRVLTALAGHFCAPGPYAASEMYFSYYTVNCNDVTYAYLPVAEFGIDDVFTEYADTGYRVQTHVPGNDAQSLINFYAEISREGPGKTLDCLPGGIEIIEINTAKGTTFQRLIGKMIEVWGAVFSYFAYVAGSESVSGFKGTQLIKRRDIRCQPQDDGSGGQGGGGGPLIIALGGMLGAMMGEQGLFGIRVNREEEE